MLEYSQTNKIHILAASNIDRTSGVEPTTVKVVGSGYENSKFDCITMVETTVVVTDEVPKFNSLPEVECTSMPSLDKVEVALSRDGVSDAKPKFDNLSNNSETLSDLPELAEKHRISCGSRSIEKDAAIDWWLVL